MISPVAAVLREVTQLSPYKPGTQSHLSTSAGYFQLLLLTPLMGPLTARCSRFTFKKQIMCSHIAYTRFTVTTGRPSRFGYVAAAPTAITIRWQVSHRHGIGLAAVTSSETGLPSLYDPASRCAGEPDTQLRDTPTSPRQTSFGRRPRATGHGAIHFARPNSTASLRISASIVFCPEGAGRGLLIGGSELGGRHHFLAWASSRQRTIFILARHLNIWFALMPHTGAT